MRVSSASTLTDAAAGLLIFSSGRDEEGSEELLFYLHSWLAPHVNYLLLYIEKALAMFQLNHAVTARAFGGLGRNIMIEEVGGKNLSGWLEELHKYLCRRPDGKVKQKGEDGWGTVLLPRCILPRAGRNVQHCSFAECGSASSLWLTLLTQQQHRGRGLFTWM